MNYQVFLLKKNNHTYGDWIVEVPSTCTKEGVLGHFTCLVCSKNYDGYDNEMPSIIIPLKEHKYIYLKSYSPTCTEQGYTENTCICGDSYKDSFIPARGHNFGDWVEEVPSTCEGTGIYGHYTCTSCKNNFDSSKNKLTTLTMPASGHKCGEWQDKVSATCYSTGIYGHYTCSKCLKNLDYNYNEIENLEIPLGDHIYGIINYGIAPTCESSGTIDYYCCYICEKNFDKNKNEVSTIVLTALGHDYSDLIDAIEATCIMGGRISHYKCSRCYKKFNEKKEEVSDIYTQAKGHDYGKYIEKVEATCENVGLLGHYACSRCKEYFDSDKNLIFNIETIETKALGHAYSTFIKEVSATCEENGTLAHYDCGRCDCHFDKDKNKLNSLVIEALGHSYGNWNNRIKPTCYRNGKLGYYQCSKCSKYFDEDYEELSSITILTPGHNYLFKETIDPTCICSGHDVYECNCGKIENRNFTVPLGHMYGELITGFPATCVDKGRDDYYQCGRCDEIFDSSKAYLSSIIIPEKGHTYNYINYERATCEEDGVISHQYCTTCKKNFNNNDEEIENVIIKAYGHSFSNLIVGRPATCNYSGTYDYYTCSSCSKYFDVNKNVITDIVIPAKGHQYGTFIELSPATCETKGILGHYNCSSCNTDFDIDKNELTNLDILPLDHSYKNGYCIRCKGIMPSQGLELHFNYTEKYYEVIGIGTCTDIDIIIPSFYNGYPVMSIDHGFEDCLHIRSVVIPDSIKYISYNAFFGCSSLISVTIGNGVKSIGDNSFRDCASLKTIVIPDSVEEIFYAAFSGCTRLTDITLSKNFKKIYPNAFYNTFLENIYITDLEAWLNLNFDDITDSVYDIFPNFKGTAHLMTEDSKEVNIVEIPNTYTSIKKHQLRNFKNITTIILSNTITSIDEYAFYGCENLTNIVLPDEIISIGNYAFSGCTKLENINFPKNLISIGNFAFEKCYLLKELNFQDKLSSIGKHSFYYCSNLVNVNIPSSLINFGDHAFYYCDNLENVYYQGTIDNWVEIPFVSAASNPLSSAKNLYINNEIVTDVKLTTATKISDYAFKNYSKLSSISIPNTVLSIGIAAFECCTGITSIVIPESVTEILYFSFSECSNLKSVTILGDILSIENRMFSGCYNLEKIVLPDTITSIENYAFYNCFSFKEIEISSSTKSIGDFAFYNCKSLLTLIIPNEVTTIGAEAFGNCTSLLQLQIGEKVEKLGNSPFYNCHQIREICNLSSALLHDSDFRAYNSEWLGSVLKEELSSLIYVGDFVFRKENDTYYLIKYLGNSSIVVLPDSSNLPEEITNYSIDSYAFNDCYFLKSITLSENVNEICSRAFNNCSNLIEIYNYSKIYIQINAYYPELSSPGGIADYAKVIITSDEVKPIIDNVDDFLFTSNYVNEKLEYYLIGYVGNNKDIVLPDSYKDSTYIIDSYAFYNNSIIETVVISDGVTAINGGAFKYCTNLKSVVLGNNVTTIIGTTFNYSYKLKDIYIPSSLKSITGAVFEWCQLENVYYSGTIDEWAEISFGDRYCNPIRGAKFYINDELVRNVVISQAEKVSPFAFVQNKFIESVVIGDSVLSIGKAAFDGCSNLTSVIIGKNVTNVDSLAFNSCNLLRKVKLCDIEANFVDGIIFGSEETIIGNSKLTGDIEKSWITSENIYVNFESWLKINYLLDIRGVSSVHLLDSEGNELTDIVIPDDITEIRPFAFKFCQTIKSVTIHDNVTSIGEDAFYWCSSLEKVIFGKKVKSVGSSAFSKSYLLKDFYIKDIEAWLKCEFGFQGTPTYNVTMHLLDEDGREVTNIIIPSTVTEIKCDYSFRNFKNVINIVLPESITTIDGSMFENCTSLVSITISKSVDKISENAFNNCKNLKVINFTGTSDEWNAITKDSNWNNGTGEYTINYNYIA